MGQRISFNLKLLGLSELSIRAGAVALVLLLGACGPATTMPRLKENVHAQPALSHKCYRLLHLALPPTVKLIRLKPLKKRVVIVYATLMILYTNN